MWSNPGLGFGLEGVEGLLRVHTGIVQLLFQLHHGTLALLMLRLPTGLAYTRYHGLSGVNTHTNTAYVSLIKAIGYSHNKDQKL